MIGVITMKYVKECAYCGKKFEATSKRQKYCKGPHYAVCPICGKKFEITNDNYLRHPVKSCSDYKCRRAATEKTSMEKYGVKNPGSSNQARKKATETMTKRLGVPYAMMSKQVREKSKETLIKTYGVDNASKSEDVKRKRHETVMKRYGGTYPYNSKETREKQKRTMLERYGSECAFGSTEIQNKVRDTFTRRYGVDNPLKCKAVADKRRKTLLDRYGVDNPFNSYEIRNKAKETMLRRYGVDNASKSVELLSKRYQHMQQAQGPYHGSDRERKYIETMMERYGVPYACLLPTATGSGRVSTTNKQFVEMFQHNGIDVHESDMEFRIENRLYDIRVPGTNILIEIDPTFTHTAEKTFKCKGLAPNYHLAKSELAKENGYQCVHVWDWDDWEKVVKLLTPKKRLYARNMSIYVLKNKDVINSFLNKNHLQGTARGQILCLGLVKDDKLYEIMTFGRPRYNKRYDTEILRLCTESGYQIVGGASKLFKYACNFGLGKIISYCDRSKFTGTVYKNMGMTLKEATSPSKVWSKGAKYITASTLAKNGYDRLFNTDYGKGTNNEQLMLEHGWLPIYNCGQYVYEFDAGL